MSELSEFIATENAKEQAATHPAILTLSAETPEDIQTSPATEQAAADAPAQSPDTPDVAAKPEAGADVADATTDTPAESQAKADDAERNPDGTFKKRDKVTNTGEWKRNQRLTAELAAAREELARLRGADSPSAAKPAPSAILDPADPEPTIEKFLDQPDPYAALAVEAAKWAVREDRRRAQLESAQRQAETAQQQLGEREAKFIESHPDYLERVNDLVQSHRWHPAVLNAIADDEQGPAVAYYLADHPDEAQRLAVLTPVAAVREIGKLIGRLTVAPVGSTAQTVVSVSRAKPLIKPVSGTPMAPDHRPPDDSAPFSQWMQYHNREERKQREVSRGA